MRVGDARRQGTRHECSMTPLPTLDPVSPSDAGRLSSTSSDEPSLRADGQATSPRSDRDSDATLDRSTVPRRTPTADLDRPVQALWNRAARSRSPRSCRPRSTCRREPAPRSDSCRSRARDSRRAGPARSRQIVTSPRREATGDCGDGAADAPSSCRPGGQWRPRRPGCVSRAAGRGSGGSPGWCATSIRGARSSWRWCSASSATWWC